MPNDTIVECQNLIDEACGLLAQAVRDLKDARALVGIMEAELAQANHPAIKRLDPAAIHALADALDWDSAEIYLLVPHGTKGQQT